MYNYIQILMSKMFKDELKFLSHVHVLKGIIENRRLAFQFNFNPSISEIIHIDKNLNHNKKKKKTMKKKQNKNTLIYLRNVNKKILIKCFAQNIDYGHVILRKTLFNIVYSTMF